MLDTRTIRSMLATFPRDDAQYDERQADEVLSGITLKTADGEPYAVEIRDRHGRTARLARWAAEDRRLAVLYRDETTLTVAWPYDAPRYVTSCEEVDTYQVYDRLNGYDLHNAIYDNRHAAWKAAQQLNADPRAAADAVTAHDRGLVASSPAGAALLDIRRYGYRGALLAEEAESLQRTDMISGWRATRKLVMVWSEEGTPFYLHPARLRTLPVRCERIDGATWRISPVRQLRRPLVTYRDAMSCPWHGRAFCTRCHPCAVWACAWDAGCGANAVTSVGHRPVCNRCTHEAMHQATQSSEQRGAP